MRELGTDSGAHAAREALHRRRTALPAFGTASRSAGHDVPEADVRRRFDRSHANLPHAIKIAHKAQLHDNASPDEPHREVAVLMEGR